MNRFFRLAVVAMVVFAPSVQTNAQEEESGVEAYVGGDLVSHYMWRGQDLAGVSIQPEARIGWNGVSLRLASSMGFDNSDTKDFDVTLAFERWGLNIGVIDYWTYGKDEHNRYFHYVEKGAHQFEGFLGYSCKYFSLLGYTMFWGNDFKASGERAYSTYIELMVPFRLGGVNWTATAGVTPFESAADVEIIENQGFFGDETVRKNNYFYAEKVTCVSAALRGTKDINLGFAQLPVFVELHANPYLQKATLLFGLTISPF